MRKFAISCCGKTDFHASVFYHVRIYRNKIYIYIYIYVYIYNIHKTYLAERLVVLEEKLRMC